MFEDLEFDPLTIGLGLAASVVAGASVYGAYKGWSNANDIKDVASKTKELESDISSVKKEQTKLRALVDSIPGLPKSGDEKGDKKEEEKKA